VALAKGHGVPGVGTDDMGQFAKIFKAALAETGPQLIELRL
jgi:thiamine pyrophosphate-dependent acetolactate synthase large subunit-like protein